MKNKLKRTYKNYTVEYDFQSQTTFVTCFSGGREFTASAGLFEYQGVLESDDDCMTPDSRTYDKLCNLIEEVEWMEMELD